MIVCVCRRVSDRDIEREVRAGCCCFDALQDELGVARSCGACADCARAVFARAIGSAAPGGVAVSMARPLAAAL